jgi:glycosyltransferase involved in cell wall biosynthesis
LLSAVVPAFNEAAGIAATVRGLAEVADEVLVVDNASTDGTAAVVERLAAADPRIRLLRNDRNRGKGHSVRRGMLAARGDLRLHCDADCGPCLPSLPRMLELARAHDVVVGSRSVPGARVARRQPLRRRIAGVPFQALCRLALGLPTRDQFCGFKLWRAPAAEAAFARVELEGWVFDAEALALARALGFSLVETGVVWEDREGSRLSMVHAFVPVVRELVRARRRVRRAAG